MLLTACIREAASDIPKTTYISIKIFQDALPQSRNGQQAGDPQDDVVSGVRVMVFGRGGNIVGNTRYSPVVNGRVIDHPIAVGDYDIVFIANEPSLSTPLLNGISTLNELRHVSFPADAFDAGLPIPMLQTITNVSVMADGRSALKDGTADIHGNPGIYPSGHIAKTIVLELDRLAARVDLTVTSNVKLLPTTIELVNLPGSVPLFRDYGGQTYGINRFYELDIISPGSPYMYKKSRMIIPSNNYGVPVQLIFKGTDKPIHWIMLQSTPGNHNLPYNSWIDVTVKHDYYIQVRNQNGGADSMEAVITMKDWAKPGSGEPVGDR